MITKKCKDCGKEFNTYPSRVKAGRGKYCSKKCSNKHTLVKRGQRLSPQTEIKPGDKPWSYKGWRYTKSREGSKKYKEIHKPNHPMANKNGYIREHRLVMANHIGRNLLSKEEIHHIDGNTLNNHISNLLLIDSKSDHLRLEHSLGTYDEHLRRLHKGGD